MAAMRPTTLRFPDSLWRMIEEEADTEGVSASDFIRSSVLAAILVRRASQNRQVGLNWERAIAEARQLLAEADEQED